MEVIKNVVSKTNHQVCFAQPVLKEGLFQLPAGCVLLQFYPEGLKDLIRYQNWWEKEPEVEVFDTRFWMWEQSISYINALFKGYGWRPTYQRCTRCRNIGTMRCYGFRRKESGIGRCRPSLTCRPVPPEHPSDIL